MASEISPTLTPVPFWLAQPPPPLMSFTSFQLFGRRSMPQLSSSPSGLRDHLTVRECLAGTKTLSGGYGLCFITGLLCLSVPKDRDAELDVARAFGARMRSVRKQIGITQEALAEAAEVHPTFISNLERGYRVPSLPTVLRVAKGLGVSGSELIEGLGST